MKAVFLVFSTMLIPMVVHADTYVRGYSRKDGTYVAPHYRSDPDSNVWNNYSTKGNVNPYTGREGTVNPYGNSFQQKQNSNSNLYLNNLNENTDD